MSDGIKFSFETLKADDVGRRLTTASGRFEVAAKLVSSGDGEVFLSVRVCIGSEHEGGGHGGSEPSAWSHTVYDTDHNIVATGYGSRERDSWAAVERTLGKKLRTGRGVRRTPLSVPPVMSGVAVEELELGSPLRA